MVGLVFSSTMWSPKSPIWSNSTPWAASSHAVSAVSAQALRRFASAKQARSPSESPASRVSSRSRGDLVGLTLIDIRRLLDEAQGELRLELPAKASPADLKLALA
jgi:hypothetical protein